MINEKDLDLVTILYQWSKEEREKHKREEGEVWIIDLVRCPLKRIFEEKFPEISESTIFSPSAIVGKLVHLGLENLLENKMENVQIEFEGEKKIKIESEEVVVKGKIDVKIEDLGIEIKSARADRGIPQEHHIDQVRAYNWLFDLKKTILIYVTPERITQYQISDRMDDNEVRTRILEEKAPRYDWECGYCPYSVLCPHKKSRESLTG